MDPILNIKILSPKENIFSGQILSLSSINSRGNFDLLPYHANFITFIENQPIILRTLTGEIKNFQFPFAIIYNSNNQLTIFTDIPLQKQVK